MKSPGGDIRATTGAAELRIPSVVAPQGACNPCGQILLAIFPTMHTPITAQAERIHRFAALLGLEVWLRHRVGEQDREVACCLNNAPLCEAIEVCQATSAAIFQLLFSRVSKRLCASHLRRYYRAVNEAAQSATGRHDEEEF